MQNKLASTLHDSSSSTENSLPKARRGRRVLQKAVSPQLVDSEEDLLKPPEVDEERQHTGACARDPFIVRDWNLKDPVAEDRRLREILTRSSNGAFPSEVYHNCMYDSSMVFFATKADDPSKVVGVVCASLADDRQLGVTWLSMLAPERSRGKKKNASTDEKEAERPIYVIERIFVDALWRRQGIGRKLLLSFHRAVLLEYPEARVAAWHSMETAGFFKAMGYEVCGKHTCSFLLTRAQHFGNIQVPDAFESGEVQFRTPQSQDNREWESLILGACEWCVGGIEVLDQARNAAFRCVAVEAATDVVIGVICMNERGWIPFLAVQPNRQNGGIGSFLLTLSLEWLRLKARSSRLQNAQASLSPLTQRNIPFYLRHGFQQDRTTGPVSDRVLFRVLKADRSVMPQGRVLDTILRNGLKQSKLVGTKHQRDPDVWNPVFADDLVRKRRKLERR